MSIELDRLKTFLEYAKLLSGDEKGEGHVFMDRFFQAFGHKGYKEAGASIEFRQKNKKGGTDFCDLVWPGRLLLEMKRRGEKLQKHRNRLFERWTLLVPHRPRYALLWNFDDLWIYDFDVEVHEPVDRFRTEELPKRYTALNFLFPDNRRPLFAINRESVTREAADYLATILNRLIDRNIEEKIAQRFVLQCVVAMFSQCFEDLLPLGKFVGLLKDCIDGKDAANLLGGLFRQMNSRPSSKDDRYKDVPYFDGGLFAKVQAVELEKPELDLLMRAAKQDWTKVAPPIFGTLFQDSMGKPEQHAKGAHFTSEPDILNVVLPSIVRPLQEEIDRAWKLEHFEALGKKLQNYQVLDPACGSGNFLYVAYRELVNLEMTLLEKVRSNFKGPKARSFHNYPLIKTKQFFGIDKDEFAVELAKVTLILGKRLALADARDKWSAHGDLPLTFEDPLPLDNLDRNIIRADALFCKWPNVDAIVGNPPFLSKSDRQRELGVIENQRIAATYPDVSGLADYCVYWFRKAHDSIKDGGRVGLIGTNTIRQNKSREGGLDYVVENGGTITEAVSSQVWPGKAKVHVSIVNWIKGNQIGLKRIFRQLGDLKTSPWETIPKDYIGPTLSGNFDVSKAKTLLVNQLADCCDQGQTPGVTGNKSGEGDETVGFVIDTTTARDMISKMPKNREVIFWYLIGDDMLETNPPIPRRCLIDFSGHALLSAQQYDQPFKYVESKALKVRTQRWEREKEENEKALKKNPKAKVNRHHENFAKRWWCLSYDRKELMRKIATIPRYIACVRTTKRPIFEFVNSTIHPGDALQVFTLDDDYSFGILQSIVHWQWFIERCSTFKRDFRYTSETVFDSFPWPQHPAKVEILAVAEKGRKLRACRRRAMEEYGLTLREMYHRLEKPGDDPVKDAHHDLDLAVRASYGFRKRDDVLEALFNLNQDLTIREAKKEEITGPGIPKGFEGLSGLYSDDRVNPEGHL